MKVNGDEEYFPILVTVIHEDLVVPFSCYIYLRANARMVRLVAANEPFEKSRIEKLSTFKIDQVYVHSKEQPAYNEYLRSFLKTAEGKAALEDALAKNAGKSQIDGIPDDIAKEFGVTEALAAAAPEAGKVAQTDEAAAVATPVATESETPVEPPPPPNDAPAAEPVANALAATDKAGLEATDPAHRRILSLLRGQAEELQGELRFRETAQDEDKTLIREITQKIKDEIERVKGRAEDPSGDQTIPDVVQRIQQELERVTGKVDKEGRLYAAIQSPVESVKSQLAELGKIVSAPEGRKPSDVVRIKRVTDKITEEAVHIKHLVDPDEAEVVGDTVNRIITGLEDVLDAHIEIRRGPSTEDETEDTADGTLGTRRKRRKSKKIVVFGEGGPEDNGAPFGKVTVVDENDPEAAQAAAAGLAAGGNADDPASIEALKEKIRQQSQTIFDLNHRLKSAVDSFRNLRERWGGVSPHVEKADKLKAKEFDVHLRDFETLHLGLKNDTDSLMGISDELCKKVGVKPVKKPGSGRMIVPGGANPEDAFAALDEAEGRAASKPKAPEALGEQATITLPPESDPDADIDTVRSENQVLRSQLMDAKSLLDRNNEKTRELQSFVDQSGGYVTALETENAEHKKAVDKLQAQAHELETKNASMSDLAQTAQRIALRAKQELQARDNMLLKARDQAAQYEQELKVFKDKFAGVDVSSIDLTKQYDDLPIPEEMIALLKAKDAQILKLNKELEAQDIAMRNLDRNMAQLKAKMEDSTTLKKRMAQRFEKLEAEKENMRREFDALNRKLAIASGLLDKERKTISRLTTIADELKRDRVEFMNKTNAAMSGYRDMISKANTLNNHVQSEMQRNKKLQEQAETLKDKSRELNATIAEIQEKARKLEAENKKLKLALSRAMNQAA